MRSSPLLPRRAAAQTDANLSTHLHRLPTPPPYLRQMRLPPGRDSGIRWVIRLSPSQGGFPDTNPCPFKHKIGIFVLFWPSGPSFSGVASTKSAFLCAFGLRNPRIQAFRAQNRGFCALFGFGALVFGRFEHKIEVFVRF